MRIAYADPPYFGMAVRFYGPQAAEYDTIEGHAALIERLEEYDGWAMSLATNSLRDIWPLCPIDTRCAAWVKPFAVFKKGVNPAYAWEPVLWRGGRLASDREQPVLGGARTTTRDFLVHGIELKRGFKGAKPESFCMWVFDLLGADPHDEFVDLFPGSGAVGEAWEKFSMSLAREVGS